MLRYGKNSATEPFMYKSNYVLKGITFKHRVDEYLFPKTLTSEEREQHAKEAKQRFIERHNLGVAKRPPKVMGYHRLQLRQHLGWEEGTFNGVCRRGLVQYKFKADRTFDVEASRDATLNAVREERQRQATRVIPELMKDFAEKRDDLVRYSRDAAVSVLTKKIEENGVTDTQDEDYEISLPYETITAEAERIVDSAISNVHEHRKLVKNSATSNRGLLAEISLVKSTMKREEKKLEHLERLEKVAMEKAAEPTPEPSASRKPRLVICRPTPPPPPIPEPTPTPELKLPPKPFEITGPITQEQFKEAEAWYLKYISSSLINGLLMIMRLVTYMTSWKSIMIWRTTMLWSSHHQNQYCQHHQS